MHPEYAPLGNVSEQLLAITLGGNKSVRDLSGRELRRSAQRNARKSTNRLSITDRKLRGGF